MNEELRSTKQHLESGLDRVQVDPQIESATRIGLALLVSLGCSALLLGAVALVRGLV